MSSAVCLIKGSSSDLKRESYLNRTSELDKVGMVHGGHEKCLLEVDKSQHLEQTSRVTV